MEFVILDFATSIFNLNYDLSTYVAGGVGENSLLNILGDVLPNII